MDRTNAPGHVNHLFVAEDPATNRPPTEITAEDLNAHQEELISIILAAGLVPSSANLGQVLAALRSAGVFQTAAKGDHTTKSATTEFVNNRGVGHLPSGGLNLTVSAQLAADSLGGWGVVSAAGITITMPAIAGLRVGSTFSFICGPDVTIKANAAENIYTHSGVANTYAAKAGELLTLTLNSNGWYVEQAGFGSISFLNNLSGSGYQKLPGGLIIQWGLVSTPLANTSYQFTFPIAFPSACMIVLVTPAVTAQTASGNVDSGAGTTSVGVRCSMGSSSVFVLAIGK